MVQQRALSHAGPSFGFPPGQVFVSAEASEEAALLQVCGIEITGRRAIPSLLSSRTLDLARACSVGAAGRGSHPRSSPETSGRPRAAGCHWAPGMATLTACYQPEASDKMSTLVFLRLQPPGLGHIVAPRDIHCTVSQVSILGGVECRESAQDRMEGLVHAGLPTGAASLRGMG